MSLSFVGDDLPSENPTIEPSDTPTIEPTPAPSPEPSLSEAPSSSIQPTVFLQCCEDICDCPTGTQCVCVDVDNPIFDDLTEDDLECLETSSSSKSSKSNKSSKSSTFSNNRFDPTVASLDRFHNFRRPGKKSDDARRTRTRRLTTTSTSTSTTTRSARGETRHRYDNQHGGGGGGRQSSQPRQHDHQRRTNRVVTAGTAPAEIAFASYSGHEDHTHYGEEEDEEEDVYYYGEEYANDVENYEEVIDDDSEDEDYEDAYGVEQPAIAPQSDLQDDPILVAEREMLFQDEDDPILVAEHQKLDAKDATDEDEEEEDYHHLRRAGQDYGTTIQHDVLERELRPIKFSRRGGKSSDKSDGKGKKYKKRRYPTGPPTLAPTYPTESQCYVDPAEQPTSAPSTSSSKSSKSKSNGKGKSPKRVKCKKDEVSVCVDPVTL